MADEQEAPTPDGPTEIFVQEVEAKPELEVDGTVKEEPEQVPELDKPEEPKPEGEEEPEKPLRDDKGQFKSRDQARFDELTRRRHEAERRATAAEAEVARLKGNATQDGAREAPVAKPSPNDFEDYGDYVEALTDWKVHQRHIEIAETAAKASRTEAETARGSDWEARVAEASASIPEWNDVVGKSEIQIAPHVADVIMESDPRVMLYLAQNEAEAAKLNDMSERQAAIAIGRIEASLGNPEPVEAKEPPARKQSQAPAPITPIRPGSNTQKDPSNMSMDEYSAWRKTQGAW